MDFFVARLMSLSEHELRCLRSDAELQSHLQRTHLLMESKLQQYSNASSSSSPCGASGAAALMLAAAAADNYAALDLRLSDPHQGQQQQQHQQYHQQHQLHHLQLHYLQQQQQQQQQHHIQQQQQQQHNQRLQQQQQQHHYEQQQQEKWFNYKKMKFIEWSSGSTDNESSPTPTSLSTASTTLARDDLAASSPTTTPTTTTNHSHHLYSAAQSPSPTSTALTTLMPQPQQPQQQQQQLLQLRAQQQLPTPTTGGGKKYKGEFDEPSALEVELRLKLLMHDDNYHSKMSPRGECACILGSEFRDKSASSVLVMVEQWRQMPTEQRVTFKWDMNDLPKDIPLSDIKRFENLRREASDGRADFGGASKRKPLGIRGTRQFLLILYCLWGHPGRDDPMQREGYCPHCFAKIKKPNEQSTLVRVVNHFNMKHRRGANPRIA